MGATLSGKMTVFQLHGQEGDKKRKTIWDPKLGEKRELIESRLETRKKKKG